MEKDYFYKIKDEIDNLSERRQAMFNVSTVIMTALVLPGFWKIVNALYKVLVEKKLRTNNICLYMSEACRKVLVIEIIYILSIFSIAILFIKIFFKHKHVSYIKYMVLNRLTLQLVQAGENSIIGYEKKLLEKDYLNCKRTKISNLEMTIIDFFWILTNISILSLNLVLKYSFGVVVITGFTVILFIIRYYQRYLYDKSLAAINT